MEKEFNLSKELANADWNIEDIWDMKKPSAQEMVNEKVKEFIKRLKEEIKERFKIHDTLILSIIDKLAGDDLNDN